MSIMDNEKVRNLGKRINTREQGPGPQGSAGKKSQDR